MAKWDRLQYQPCFPLGEDGRRVTACQKHIDLSRKAARGTQGTVLCVFKELQKENARKGRK